MMDSGEVEEMCGFLSCDRISEERRGDAIERLGTVTTLHSAK